MAQGIQGFLCNQDLAADGALHAHSQAGLGAGGGDSGKNFLGVTQGVHGFLCNQDLAADGALLALSQAGLGTGGGHGGENFFRMAQGVGFIGKIGDTADGAHMGGIAAMGAVGGSGDAVSGNVLGVQHTVHIEHILTILKKPAVFQGVDQGIAVPEGGIFRTKGGTPVAGVAGIEVGGQTVDGLVGGIGGEGVQRSGGQIECVAQRCAVDRGQRVGFIPCGLVPGCQGDAADHTDGIGGGRIDGGGLLDPVQGHIQDVGPGIQLCAAQREIFILKAQSGQIRLEIGVDLNGRPNLGQDADPVGQLQQEAPGGAVGLICAGEHIGQLLQLLGHRNGRHVDGEGVVGDHGRGGIHDPVGAAVLADGVGDTAQPGKTAVAAGGLVKVKDHIAPVVHGDGDGVPDVGPGAQGSGDEHGFQAGFLLAGEGKVMDLAAGNALVTGADLKAHIGGGDCHGSALIQSGQGQGSGFPKVGVEVASGEVKGVGNHHMKHDAADDRAVEAQRDLRIARRGGGEAAIGGNRAHGFVGNAPGKLACGDGRFAAPGGDTGGGEHHMGIGRQIGVFCMDARMVKGGIVRRIGDHQQHGAWLCGIFRVVGEGCRGFGSGDKGGVFAAIHLKSVRTSGIEQDPGKLSGGGAVHGHEHGLAGSGDAHGGCGGPLSAVGGDASAVLHQGSALQDRLQTGAVSEGACGEFHGVDARNDRGGIGLGLGQQGSGTGCRIDPHIRPVQVCGCDVPGQVLSIIGRSGNGLPGDAGGQEDGFPGADRECGIPVVLHIVACGTPQPVCKGIADSPAQVVELFGAGGEGAGALQGGIDPVSNIGLVNCSPELGAVGDTLHPVGQEVGRPAFIGQTGDKVALQKLGQQTGVVFLPAQLGHEIEGIQIAVQILTAEGFHFAAQVIPGEDGADHLLHRIEGGHIGFSIHQIQQIHQVACPASHIRVVGAAGVVAGDVHGAEHVGEFQRKVRVAGGGELLQIPDADHGDQLRRIGERGVVGILIGQHIGGEGGVFVARHDGPGSGGVAGDAGTDVVEHQRRRIRAGIFLHIPIRDLLQEQQIIQEGSIVGHRRPLQDGVLLIGGVAAAGAGLIGIPAHAGVGGQLFFMVLQVVPQGRDLGIIAVAADAAGVGSGARLGAGGDPGDAAVAIAVAGGGSFVGYIAVAADSAGMGGETGLGTARRGHLGVIAVSQGGNTAAQVAVAADRAGIGGEALLGAGGGCYGTGIGVSGGGDGFGIGFTAAGAGVENAAVGGAGGLRPGGDSPVMPQGRDHAAAGFHIVAAAAVCAGGFAVGGTGGIFGGGVDHVMAQRSHGFRPGIAAGGAGEGSDTLGQTAGGDGVYAVVIAVAGGGDGHFLAGQLRMAAGAGYHGIIASVLGAARGLGVLGDGLAGDMAGGGDHLGIGAAAFGAGIGDAAVGGAGGIHRDRVVAVAALDVPCAVLIAIGVGGGGKVGAVGVLQFGRGDGDGGIGDAGAILGGLIGGACGNGGQLHDAAFHAGDGRAALGGVQLARGGIQGAGYLDPGIAGDGAGTAGGGFIGSSGGVGHGPELGIAVNIAAPLIPVIDIQPDTGGQHAGCARAHDQLRIGLQGQILPDGGGAALQLDGDAAVDGQHIVAGVDGHGGDGQGHGLQGHGAVGPDAQPVGAAVILLGHRAGGKIKHGAAGADELDGGMVFGAGHIQGGVAVLRGAGLQSHGGLHILHIVLAQGEYLLGVAVHGQGGIAAPKVDDLEIFIYTGAGHDLHGALAGDVAVGVESAADFHRAALLECHAAVLSNGSAAAAGMPGRHTHGAVDGQVCTGGQGQGAVGGGGGAGGGALGCRGKDGTILIGRDQQGDALGDGVVAGGQGAVADQDDHIAADRRGQRLGQAVIEGFADPEAGIAAGGDEQGPDGGVIHRLQEVGGLVSCNGTVGGVDPADEGITRRGRSHQRDALAGGDALQGGAGSDGRAAGSHGAHGVVKIHGDTGGILGCGQRKIRQVQGGCGGGEQGAAGGGHGHGLGFSGFQHPVEGSGIGALGEGEGAGGRAAVIEADGGRAAGGVGDGDGVGAGAAGGQTAGALDRDLDTVAGNRHIGGRIRHGDPSAEDGAGSGHRLDAQGLCGHDLPGEGIEGGIVRCKPQKLLLLQAAERIHHGLDLIPGLAEGVGIHGIHGCSDLGIGHKGGAQMVQQERIGLGLKLLIRRVRHSRRVGVGFRPCRGCVQGHHGNDHDQHQQQTDAAFDGLILHNLALLGVDLPVYCINPENKCP